MAQYALQTDVPAYGYQLVPERGADGAVWLRLGRFVTGAQVVTPPDGRLLQEHARLTLRSDAVPEAGVRVVRHRMVSRWIDGSLHAPTQRAPARGGRGEQPTPLRRPELAAVGALVPPRRAHKVPVN